jgi:hydroxymethylglutaryl-CoA reductase
MNGIDAVLATGNDFRAVEAEFAYAANQVNTLVYHAAIERILNFG